MKRPRLTNSIRYRLGRHLGRTKSMLLNRRGDGVHSPFAFRLIRQVLRNPHPYTAFGRLGELHRAQRKTIGRESEHRAITRRKHLEIIFRLSADCPAERVLLVSPSQSLVPAYIIEARPQAKIDYHSTDAPLALEQKTIDMTELIVLEDATETILTLVLQALSSKARTQRTQTLILNTYNPRLRAALRGIAKEQRADVQFDLKGLEIWVWRKGITPGRYSVYC